MNYFVILEFVLLCVYTVENIKADTVYTNLYWLLILIYACLKLLFYIVFEKKISRRFIVVITLLVGVIGWFYYPILLFFPLCINQANLFSINKRWAISLVTLLWLFVIPIDFLMIYLLSLVFSFILVFALKEYSERIDMLEEKLEKTQVSNNTIKNQLDSFSQASETIAYQSQLEERNKLSQTLHDELGHTLSGNILRLEAIKMIIDKDGEKASSMLQEVIGNLRRGMDSIRSILKSIKPEISTINISNLKIIIENVKNQSNVNIALNYNSDISEITPQMWQVIIPNIKEALTNMMRYSNADNCEIDFVKLNKVYRITVKDDGVGCENIKKGLGILGIEERMISLGGNAIFDSKNGFSTTMIFPI
ncbi:MAG: histidine kinase [Eubacteriales bacterium]